MTTDLFCGAGPFAAAQPATAAATAIAIAIARITTSGADRNVADIVSVSAATSAAAAHRVHEARRSLRILCPGIG
jgi:hypothetical protein